MTESDDKLLYFRSMSKLLIYIKTLGCLPRDFFYWENKASKRRRNLGRFKSLPGPRGLLMAFARRGSGLNIQEASSVVLFDRWESRVENQAIQRAHRFGELAPSRN